MPRSVTGHDVTETLYESDSSLMVRTAPVEGQPPVILKILKKAFPSPRELERFRQEYGVTRSLDSRGIIKVYGLETHENTLMLLVEDFGGESLSQWLQQRTFDLETFLSLAVRITESLGDIHSSQIIHKDINPSNIVWNAATDELKIIDFGVSTHLSRTHSLSGQPDALDGTLAYMSPEQTGRMNASVDHRADFYSLGVTFYELLTGQLPFSTDDSNELVHCHIAREPAPAHLIEPAVPVAVSNIVEKLMAKKAEGRYQHTGGILADLEHALSQLRTTRQIAEFTLGEQDCCGQLHVSRTLYGRDDEVRILHDGYDRVAAGGTSEMVLVAGYSGVGKTSLIREIQRPIVQGQGLFAAGKFDQFQREIPYSAIVEAFQGLICELLAAPAEQVNEWRRLLLSKLHGNGQLIVDVVPDVEFLIGPQPTVPTLGPTEAFNRFNRVFQEFISAFSQPSCPLTLVLDDLQWADAASLQLLRMLMGKSGVRDLLLLGAYRDNEIDPAHPLLPAVEAIEAEGTRVQTLTLQPLAERHVTQLLSDTLNAPLKHVEPLCRLLLARTEGNPFFLNQFLTALYQAELLVFDREHMAWTWKNEEIEKSKISENVVELMIWQVADLPADTQEALRIGSCIGNRFDLRTLSIVLEQSFEQTCQTIRPAVDSGLLLSAESLDETGQQSGVLSADASIQNAPVASFRFLHDRVQQAAYSLTSDESQPQTHLTIGRLLLANMNAEQLEDSLFEVVNHLNQGRELIDSDAERRQVAELNLRATRKSRLSSAYSPALKYICSGIDFLSHDCWESEYSFALSYWLEKGEVEYLNADWNDSLATLNEALERTTDLLDRCAINERKSTLYRMKNDLRKSLDVALDALAELGIELEAFPDDAATVGDLTRAREMIEGVQWDALDSLPELRDPAKLAAMALLRECFAPAYFLGSSLISMIGTRMTEITFTHGNSPHSATGYIFFASITLSTGLKDFDAAYRVGQLALTVNGGTRADRANEALILDMWGTFVCHYKEPIDNARDCMIRGYRSGVENGAYQWAGYCAAINLFMSFWGPDTLGAVSKQIDDVIPGLQKIDPNMAQYYRAISATIHNVTVETDNHCQLSAEKWPDVQEIYDRGREQNDVFTLLVVTTCQLALANWFDERTRAAEFAEIGEEFATGDTGVFLTPVFRFHQCLAYCGVCETVDEQKRQQYIDRIEATIRSFEQMAEHCPSTYLHQANLCKAELARIRGNAAEAMNLYDEAISAAKDSGFLQNEALANELAARFWVALGKENISKIYFKEAAYRYWLWGAQPKAQLLRVEYEDSYQTAQFTEALPLRPAGNQPNGSTDEQPVTPSGLDLDSIGKGVRTISGEISIDCLPDKIIRTMVECAGAESGFLVLENSGDLQMAAACGPAEFDADGQNLNAAPGKRGAGSVIEFVARTGRRLLLDDATKNEPFSADPDLKRRQVLSVLCFPLSLHDNQRAYVYLENTLASHAFDADSMGVVEVLAAQASASLSNAKGYEALRKSEETLRVREEQFRLFSQSTGDCFWNWDMVVTLPP
jgi:predicted ATPase/GAF domain-containing protein